MKDLRHVSGYEILYGGIKDFVAHYLFNKSVDIDDLNTLRNLTELESNKTIVETFKKKINELTVLDKGSAEIRDYIKLGQTRPFVVKEQGYIISQKSIFNKMIGDSLPTFAYPAPDPDAGAPGPQPPYRAQTLPLVRRLTISPPAP